MDQQTSILFQAFDPRGFQVVLTTEGLYHIGTHHSEMHTVPVKALEETISDPDAIFPAKGESGLEFYFRLGAFSAAPRLYLSIVVEQTRVPGEIVTAYPQPTIGGVGGSVIYVRPTKR